jgi:formylglycine-generating enzyme required for sulfatase activity/serine/threonine protein kinase
VAAAPPAPPPVDPPRVQRAPPTAIPSLLPPPAAGYTPEPVRDPVRAASSPSAPVHTGETGLPSIGPAAAPTLSYQGVEGSRTIAFAGRPITIGRGSQCDLRLGVDGDKVSRKHTTFEWDGNAVWVGDSSANGTFVDNTKVEGRVRVEPGRRVWITRYRRPDGQWDSEHVITVVPPGGTAVTPLAAAPVPGPATRVFRAPGADAAAPKPPAAPPPAAPAAPPPVAPEPAAAPPPWSRVGNINLIGHFAQSPYGSIYRGEQELSGDLRRKVLIKVFHQLEGKGKEAARKKFLAESRILLELSHPGIVRVLDVGEHDEVPYLVMEHLTTTLAARMKEGPLPPDRVREFIRQAASALQVLHEHPLRILHRDIKGESLWMDDFGNVRLADFGLAKLVEHDPTMKPGTLRYTAPETFNPAAGTIGPASDLYSLGWLAYEAACGEARFAAEFPDIYRHRGREEVKWMEWHTAGAKDARPLSQVIAGFPDDLARLIAMMTARSIGSRPADCRSVLAALSGAPATPLVQRAAPTAPAPAVHRAAPGEPEHKATMVVPRGAVAAAVSAHAAVPASPPAPMPAAAVPTVGPSATEESYDAPPPVRTVVPQSDSGPVPDEDGRKSAGSPMGMYLIIGSAVLVVGLATAWFLMRSRGGGDGDTPKDGTKDDTVEKKTDTTPVSTDWLNAAEFTNSVGMKFVKVRGGSFLMGSPRDEADRDPNESDPTSKSVGDLHMAASEVTLAAFRRFKSEHSQEAGNPEGPVAGVSFPEAERFCAWLGEQPDEKKAGRAYRLPTEAEWEYACRAGTTAAFAGNVEEMAWYRDNSNRRARQTASKKPNAWGLFDMHGNVWEWCADAGSQPDSRVTRGGSYLDRVHRCRSAARQSELTNERRADLGFRVVCVKN